MLCQFNFGLPATLAITVTPLALKIIFPIMVIWLLLFCSLGCACLSLVGRPIKKSLCEFIIYFIYIVLHSCFFSFTQWCCSVGFLLLSCVFFINFQVSIVFSHPIVIWQLFCSFFLPCNVTSSFPFFSKSI
jgi:hypothetical protein